MTRRRAWPVLAIVALLPACGLAEVQVPISFEVDRDLKFLEPDDTERVSLPVTVAWKAGADALEGGNRFAVFLDKSPVGPRDIVRIRLCGDRESEPPVAGQNRRRCREDLGRHVWLTRDTELVLDCIRPREGAPDRVRNRHTLSVIVVDEDNVRVGQAGISRTFEIRDDAALRACSGEV
jgi:hypothetical protein